MIPKASELSHLFSRAAVLVLTLVLLVVAGFFAAQAYGQSSGGPWDSTTSLLTQVGMGSCAVDPDYGYVFCVGGITSPSQTYTNQVEVGSLMSTGGVASWNTTTNYPFATGGQSCVAYSLSIICVGGYYQIESGFVTVTNSVNSAPIIASGLGSWTAQTSFPFNVALESCVVNGAYIDCIGGYNGLHENSTVYYAPLSRNGAVGTWANTTSYPISVNSPSCVAVSGYVYCVGGATGSSGYNNVYYAPLLSAGAVGSWTQTTSYPTTVYSHSCAAATNYIYCVGGYANKQYTSAAYYAPLSAAGVGAWTQVSNYPFNVDLLSCIGYDSAVYCLGGFNTSSMTDSVYYYPVPPFQAFTTTITTTSTSTVTSSKTSTVTSVTTNTTTTTVTSRVTLETTSTRTSSVTSFKTSTVTSSIVNTTTSTTTATTTLTSTSTLTETPTTQPFAPGTLLVEVVAVAVGIAAGIGVASLYSRRRRGKPSGSYAKRARIVSAPDLGAEIA